MSVITVAECPVCGGDLSLDSDVIVGELLDCDACGSEIEVRALKPNVHLEEAPVSAEDWGE